MLGCESRRLELGATVHPQLKPERSRKPSSLAAAWAGPAAAVVAALWALARTRTSPDGGERGRPNGRAWTGSDAFTFSR